MATSLAEQLKRLAVPQTNLLQNDKKKTSFLFDPKDAATLRKETVYEIGLEGLEELVTKNEAFKQFKNSLFHATSKNFERSVQTKEDNKKVHKTINQFLLLLSPYFLTNAAHKALEWLFHRFMIHECNRKELIMLVLPYHNSNIFVKVIQTLKFKDDIDSFNFLKPLQKPGLHLPKQSLLNNASSNIMLLKCISKYIQQLIDTHENANLLTAQFNFYCTVFLGAIEYSEIGEDLVSQMLPLILKGLNSSIPDFAAASYVISARLLVKRQFAEKLLNKIVAKLSVVKCSSLKMEATLVMLVIYQSQSKFISLPAKALKNLSAKEWLPNCLQYLNSNGNNIYPFLAVLIKKAAEEGVNNNVQLPRELTINILNEVKLDNFFVETFLSSILDVLDPEIVYSKEANQWLSEVVNKLELQYPSHFDHIVDKILKKEGITLEKKNSLRKILGHVMIHKENFETFNNLYHTREEIREQAFKLLSEKFKDFKISEKELFKGYLYSCLYDENPEAVKKILNLIIKLDIKNDQLLQTSLTDLLKKGTLILKKGNLLLKKENLLLKRNVLLKKWQDVFILASNLLCEDKEFTWDIFLSLFPIIILYSDKCLKDLKRLFELPFFSGSKLFSTFNKRGTPIHDCKQFVTRVLACFDSNVDSESIKDFLRFLDDHKNDEWIIQYSAIFILSHMLPNSCSPEIGASIIQYVKTCNIGSRHTSSDTSTLEKYLQMSSKNKYPLEGIKDYIEKIIFKTINTQRENWESVDFYKETVDSKFLQNLFSLVFSENLFADLFEKYLNAISSNINTKITFCLNTCVSEIISEKCVTSVLNFIDNIVNTKGRSKDIHVENLTISYLLVLLDNTNAEVRKSVFNLIQLLLKNSAIRDKSYGFFLEQLLKYRDEIIVDNEQTSLILQNLLAPARTRHNDMDSDFILSDLLRVACDNSSPIYLKSGILTVLSHINNFDIFENLCKNLLQLYYANDEAMDKYQSIILLKLINRLDSHIISEVSLESNIWKFIKYALTNNRALIINDQKTYLTGLMLNQITRDVYAMLSEELLEELLDIICEVSVAVEDPEVLALSSKIFKHLDLNARLITNLLQKMKDVQVNTTGGLQRKRRINITPTVDILDTLEWKKGMSVLEFLQGKKKIRNGEYLLPSLFDILKKCLAFEEQAAVEYPKQLILSLMLLICSKVEIEDVPKNAFNIELVIQCIRASQNPQTHHHALLVLANTAELVPTEVLHHIMTVFTFMGSSLIRHDDAYSFQIIAKIIDTIIPILVSDGNQNAVVNVLRVFVDALLDVPEHRRIPLYNQLLTKIGTKDNLYLFLLLVFEAQVLHATQEKRKTEKGGLPQRLKIAQNICLDFSPKITLSCCILLVKYLRQLPDEKDDIMKTDKETFLCNALYTSKQFRHYKYLIVTFITSLLSSHKFVNEIAQLADEENLSMEDRYKELIVTILTYIQRIQKVSEKASNTQQAQYWKTVLYHSYDILDSVNALLTPQMFILVTKGLLMHNIQTVKRRALELLNSKLQLNPQYFDDCDESEMYALLPPVITIIELLNKEEMVAEYEILVQTALLSLKLLVKGLGSHEPERIVKILEFITSIICSGKVQNNVLASVILCLVELCVHLKAHAISCLAEFMPAFLTILKNQKYQEASTLLLLSVVTAVNKLLDSLSLFLSPYLKKIVYDVSILVSKWDCVTKDQKSLVLVSKLNSIKQKIGSRMPPRVLLPVIEQCYDSLVSKKHFKAIGALMDILSESINHLPMKDINSFMQELTNLFLKALQFRCDNNVTLEDGNLVEEQIVKALTVLVLKLSESTFRPLFLKIYDWAVRNEGKSDRLITFYNLSQNIARSLKGLFVLFANHFLNNSSQILTKINTSSSEESYFNDELKNTLLLEFVLKTLQTIFTYDNQKFVNKSRFDLLMQPLVDQLENTIGGIEFLVKRNESLLTPTIVHFLVAAADDALWKQMNYQILLKMRNAMPEIRLAALHCLTEVVNKLGEDFLPLLPETIPFLSELLEDEEEKVEKACKKAIQEMEKVLGEPLQKYF